MTDTQNPSVARPSLAFDPPYAAVVIGGGGAIGTACVRAFAASGANVWSVDISERAAAGAIAGLEGSHQSIACDVTDADAVERVALKIGAADCVVYAAGLNYDSSVMEIDWQAYRRTMAVNLDGAFHVSSSFARRMIASNRPGSFVLLSSTAGLRGEAGASVYCATKFGLIGLAESMAAELSRHQIRVNAVCPGNVDSPMLKEVALKIAERTGAGLDDIWQGMATSGAATRLVHPGEVAKLCLYLASPLSSAITGTTIRVDAGAMLSV